jgi:uncharacterized protein YdeI (YjbR/CyaY-like superfamily)
MEREGVPRDARKPLVRPAIFRTAADFRAWLEAHHGTARELLVRCYKNHARRQGLTYFEALDEALCFGWIDGVRGRIDEDSFSVRFTPRKPKSVWSAINIERAGKLRAAGRMRPVGLAAFRGGKAASARRYSYESKALDLDPAYVRKLQNNRRAWAFFEAQPPWYRRTTAFWVMSAARPETRERRLEILIASAAEGARIPPLVRPGGRAAGTRRRTSAVK